MSRTFAILAAAAAVLALAHAAAAVPQSVCTAQANSCSGCYAAGCAGFYYSTGFNDRSCYNSSYAPGAPYYSAVPQAQCDAWTAAVAIDRCNQCVTAPAQANKWCSYPGSTAAHRCVPASLAGASCLDPTVVGGQQPFIAPGNWSGCPWSFRVQALYVNDTLVTAPGGMQYVDVGMRNCIALAPAGVVAYTHSSDTYFELSEMSGAPYVTTQEGCTGTGCSGCNNFFGSGIDGVRYSTWYHYANSASLKYYLTLLAPFNPNAAGGGTGGDSSTGDASTGSNGSPHTASASAAAVALAAVFAVAMGRL